MVYGLMIAHEPLLIMLPPIQRCIGKPAKGVTVKFSDGDHGEILIKTAVLFSRYVKLIDELGIASA